MSITVPCNSSGWPYAKLTTLGVAKTHTGIPLLCRKQTSSAGQAGLKAKDPRTGLITVHDGTVHVCQDDPGKDPVEQNAITFSPQMHFSPADCASSFQSVKKNKTLESHNDGGFSCRNYTWTLSVLLPPTIKPPHSLYARNSRGRASTVLFQIAGPSSLLPNHRVRPNHGARSWNSVKRLTFGPVCSAP